MLSLPKILLRLLFLSCFAWTMILFFESNQTKKRQTSLKARKIALDRIKDITQKHEKSNTVNILDSEQKLETYNEKESFEKFGNLQFCRNISRPESDNINYRNERWQYFVNGNREVYILDVYYDDRGDVPLIRILPVAVVPEKTLPNNDTLYALLWYDDLAHPVSVECPCKANHTTQFWHIKKHQYGMLYHKIALERTDKLPTHVSIMHSPCSQPRTYMKLVVPEKPLHKSRDIALCVKAIWGNHTYKNAPYFVNWMETMRLYGLHKVHMYTFGLHLLDDAIKAVFDYYVKTGFLYVEFLHNNLYETDTIYMDDAISQALVLPVVNDCFYRNMHKYDFILHHDLDELLVPKQHTTYRQLLDYFISENEKYNNYESLISRSAFFYTFNSPSHPEYPEYMTFLRYAYRQPIEIPGVTWHHGNGVMKSFQNARTCAIISIHECKRSVKGDGRRGYGHTFIPPELVISHHYRKTCKLKRRCDTELERRFVDSSILDSIGPELLNNVRSVLEETGYFKML